MVLSCSASLFAQSVYVPLNHWAYDFIERLETKGLITGVLNGSKPYSREEMANYLLQAEQKIQQGYPINRVEYDQLQFLKFEFKEEFEKLSGRDGFEYKSRIEKFKESRPFGKIFPKFLYRNGRNLFYIEKDQFRIFIDPVFFHDWQYADVDTVQGTEKVLKRGHGLTFWGNLGNYLAFFFDSRDTKEWGSLTYPRKFEISLPHLGFVNGYGTHIWHDETVAYLVFKLPYLQISLGKDFNYWGPGFNGALGLSNNATSYDQIKLVAKFWRLKFTYLWAFLQPYPPILKADSTSTAKNLVAHRLEIDVTRWLDIGLYETVIWGNRRFELAYLNPINFYRSAEHFLNEDDNVAMGFDFEFMAIPNTKIYGELFIDDLFTAKLGSNWFGNKTAYLLGALWVDALRIPNLDLRIEYAHIRPFVYSHKKKINTYSHFLTGLGHWIGPNSDDFLFNMDYRFSKSLLVSFQFETYRHGANEPNRNVGGDINRDRFPGDPDFVAFLEGIKERRHNLRITARYEIFRNLYVNFSFDTSASKNILLPNGLRGPIDRKQFLLSMELNK